MGADELAAALCFGGGGELSLDALAFPAPGGDGGIELLELLIFCGMSSSSVLLTVGVGRFGAGARGVAFFGVARSLRDLSLSADGGFLSADFGVEGGVA